MLGHLRSLREDQSLSQKQLAEFYHTSIDYLVGYTDDPTPYPKTRLRR